MVMIVAVVFMPGVAVVVVAVIVVVRVGVVVVGVVVVGRSGQGALSPRSQRRPPGVVRAGLRAVA